MTIKRNMPSQLQLGQHMCYCVGQAVFNWREPKVVNTEGLREVMGYFLPTWQRGLVWSEEQNVKLLESLWLGINIGNYTFNRPRRCSDDKYDNLLIDGQQRLWAIQCYLQDEFPVFGYRWSETTEVDKRCFEYSTHFHCYITNSNDEAYLKGYYNTMNFSGTSHKTEEKAT
jgi:hypothetical protein